MFYFKKINLKHILFFFQRSKNNEERFRPHQPTLDKAGDEHQVDNLISNQICYLNIHFKANLGIFKNIFQKVFPPHFPLHFYFSARLLLMTKGNFFLDKSLVIFNTRKI